MYFENLSIRIKIESALLCCANMKFKINLPSVLQPKNILKPNGNDSPQLKR